MNKTVATKYTGDTHTFSVEVGDFGVQIYNANGTMAKSALVNLHKFLGEVLIDLGEEPAVVEKPKPETAPFNPRFVADDTGTF